MTLDPTVTGSLDACVLVDLPMISDSRGNLTFVEGGHHVPFEIRRVYYLYDMPGGIERGEHAHLGLRQLIVPMAGRFDITLDDGTRRETFHLNRPHVGLYVCPMIWREIDRFSSDAVCLVLASERYNEADYIRDYDAFVRQSQPPSRP